MYKYIASPILWFNKPSNLKLNIPPPGVLPYYMKPKFEKISGEENESTSKES